MSRATKPRILVADDDAILREIAAATLREAGFEVQNAATGDSAVAACALRMPDMALLDVEMPDGNGYQTCANIRKLLHGENLPILVMTGHDDSRSIALAYEAGATDFVVKPLNWALLTHRIRYVLRGARTVAALRLSEQKNEALLQCVPDGILLLDREGSIEHCYSPLKGMFDQTNATVGNRRFFDLLPEAIRTVATTRVAETLRGADANFEFSLMPQGVPPRHFECRLLPNCDANLLAIVRDVSLRRQSEERIQRLAYVDALTDLPNREWIREYLSLSLIEANRLKRHLAVLYVDLDFFKRINDTLGHDTGDALLRQVAHRLATAFELNQVLDIHASLHRLDVSSADKRPRGQLARVGGDAFLVVLNGRVDVRQAQQAAMRILELHAIPFLQGSHELVVTPSIGVSLFPEHGRDAQGMLKNAESAMYQAKSAGRNQFHVFDGVQNARALKRLSLELELRRALENDTLDVCYQPKYEACSLRMVGGEAQLRWVHAERGQIPASDFLGVAEETGLIADLGRYALQCVCRDLAQWRAAGATLPRIAIKVSGREFSHPDALLRLRETLDRFHLPPSLIELELTEGVLMHDVEAGRRTLLALKEFGFSLAVDDFGTGYCSLNYLKRFPLDSLKIDRCFVADIADDPRDAAIVRAIIGLGRSLNLQVIAQGVENSAQLQFLKSEGCDLVQGFLLNGALPAAEFLAMLSLPTPAPFGGELKTQRSLV